MTILIAHNCHKYYDLKCCRYDLPSHAIYDSIQLVFQFFVELLITVLVPGLIGLFVALNWPNDRINMRRRGEEEREV